MPGTIKDPLLGVPLPLPSPLPRKDTGDSASTRAATSKPPGALGLRRVHRHSKSIVVPAFVPASTDDTGFPAGSTNRGGTNRTGENKFILRESGRDSRGGGGLALMCRYFAGFDGLIFIRGLDTNQTQLSS